MGVTQKLKSDVLCLSVDCRTFVIDASKVAVLEWIITVSALGGSELPQKV